MPTHDLRDIRSRITAYSSDIDGHRGDHVLNPHYRNKGPMRNAAVLVPLIERPGGATVLFTLRTDNLSDHPGQISFPGGHVDDGDASAEHTALRETEEEVGIAQHHIEIIGRIDTYLTGTGFSVTPVVGVVTPPFEISPDPTEVAEVFEVPLAFLLDPQNHQRETRYFDDLKWYSYAMPFNGYHIWGITAGMLRNFYEVLAGNDMVAAKLVDKPNTTGDSFA